MYILQSGYNIHDLYMFRSSDSVYIFYYMECFLLRPCYYSFPNQFELFMHAYRIDIVDLPSSPTQGSDSSIIITDDLCPWIYNQPGYFQSIKLILELF